jgi:hypothetical protein
MCIRAVWSHLHLFLELVRQHELELSLDCPHRRYGSIGPCRRKRHQRGLGKGAPYWPFLSLSCPLKRFYWFWQVELGTLMFFAGLFVLMKSLEELQVMAFIADSTASLIAQVPEGMRFSLSSAVFLRCMLPLAFTPERHTAST